MPMPIHGILAFFGSPVAKWLGAVVAVAALLGGAYLAIDSRAVARCEREHGMAAIHAQEEAHQFYLTEVERGNDLSATLVQTQRRLDATKSEYHAYANAITGNCDPSFRVFVEYASGAKTDMPEAPGAPVDGPFAEDALERAYQEAVARRIGRNVAENFSRLDFCVAEKRAINAWHNRPEEAMK